MSLEVLKKTSFHPGHAAGVFPLPFLGDEWVEQVKTALAEIEKLPIGKALLDEIRSASKTANILKSAVRVSPLIAEEPLRTNDAWADPSPWGYASIKTVEAMNKVLDNVKTRKSAYLEEFKKLLNEYAKVQFDTANEKLVDLGLNTANEQQLMYELERNECMECGPGTDCYIRWDPEHELVGSKKEYDFSQKENEWRTRPPWIGLAHELVHAWRFVMGSGIFPEKGDRIKDELLTTGLSPYPNAKYSENTIRAAAKQPLRLAYGLSDHSAI
jgi:hypothetical protein